MKTIVFGPPGTGKTHTLLEKVDEYLKTTNPDRIGYFAFTKKAANEAKERAMKKFSMALTRFNLESFGFPIRHCHRKG